MASIGHDIVYVVAAVIALLAAVQVVLGVIYVVWTLRDAIRARINPER